MSEEPLYKLRTLLSDIDEKLKEVEEIRSELEGVIPEVRQRVIKDSDEDELFYVSFYVAEGREDEVPRRIAQRTLDLLRMVFAEAIDDGVIDIVYHEGG